MPYNTNPNARRFQEVYLDGASFEPPHLERRFIIDAGRRYDGIILED